MQCYVVILKRQNKNTEINKLEMKHHSAQVLVVLRIVQ